MLSFEIDNPLAIELKEISSQVSIKNKEIQTLGDEERQAIHRFARVSTVGASTRIENAILTDAEVLWLDTTLSQDARPTAFAAKQALIFDKLSKDRERSIEEVAGCRNLLFLIYEQARDLFPLSESTLQGLHRELLRHYPPARHYLGAYKTVPNSVIEKHSQTGKERPVFKTADPGVMTQTAMQELLGWYRQTLPEHPWSLAVAAELVFRFLAIHPFQDGNGRLGRGLFLLALLQSPDADLAALARYVALDRQIEKNKQEYYYVLQRCSEGRFHQDARRYRIVFFLKYLLKMFRLALEDIDVYRRKYAALQQLSTAASQVFQCFREYPEKRLQTAGLMTHTALPRRTVVHALNTLMKYQLIQKYGQGPATRYQVTF